jgi:hypothetical protein
MNVPRHQLLRKHSTWPPPPNILAALRRARKRLHRLPDKSHRPNLDCPTSALGLFSLAELRCLSATNYWPLPWQARCWLQQAPADRRHQRQRDQRRLFRLLVRLVAEQPDLVADLLAQLKGVA